MDLKDAKTQKIALVVIVCLIGGYLWWTRIYDDLDKKLAAKTAELEAISTNLRNVELKAKSLDALKLEYQELLAKYQEIEELLPEVKQIPSFLVQLHTASSITGTKITRVHPLAIRSEEFYNIAEFDIEITGTYHDFGTFVSYIANFPFIANVSGVKVNAVDVAIKKADNEETGGLNELKKRETITAQFKLATYFVKEEERLKELVI